jgi:hypothetical protein
MSGDIRSLGQTGQAVFQNAERLKGAKLIDDAQFKELTNDRVGPQDIAIANQALDKIKADTPDAMNLMYSIPKMNNQILDLQRQQQGAELQSELKAAGKSIMDRVGSFIGNFFNNLPTTDQIIRNINR